MSKALQTTYCLNNSQSQASNDIQMNLYQLRTEKEMMLRKLINKSKNKGVLTIGEHENMNAVVDTDSDFPVKKCKGVAKLICINSSTQPILSKKPLIQTREKLSTYLIKKQMKPLENAIGDSIDERQKSNKKDYSIVFPGKENSKEKLKASTQQSSLVGTPVITSFYLKQKSPQAKDNPLHNKLSFNPSNQTVIEKDNFHHCNGNSIKVVPSKLFNKINPLSATKQVIDSKSRNNILPTIRLDFENKIENEKESDDNFEYNYYTQLVKNANHNTVNKKTDQGGKVSLMFSCHFYEYIKKFQLKIVMFIQRAWREHSMKTGKMQKVIRIQSFWRRYWLRFNLYYVIQRYYKGRAFIIHMKKFLHFHTIHHQLNVFRVLSRETKPFDGDSALLSKCHKQKAEDDIDSFKTNSPSSLKNKTQSTFMSYNKKISEHLQCDLKQSELIAFDLRAAARRPSFSVEKSEMFINNSVSRKVKEYKDLYLRLLKDFNDFRESVKIKRFDMEEFNEDSIQLELLEKKKDYQLLLMEHNQIAFTYENIQHNLMLNITKKANVSFKQSVPSIFPFHKIKNDGLITNFSIDARKPKLNLLKPYRYCDIHIKPKYFSKPFSQLRASSAVSLHLEYQSKRVKIIKESFYFNIKPISEKRIFNSNTLSLSSIFFESPRKRNNTGFELSIDHLAQLILLSNVNKRQLYSIESIDLSSLSYSLSDSKAFFFQRSCSADLDIPRQIIQESIRLSIKNKKKKKSLSVFSKKKKSFPQMKNKKLNLSSNKRGSCPQIKTSSITNTLRIPQKLQTAPVISRVPITNFSLPANLISKLSINPSEKDNESFLKSSKQYLANKFKHYLNKGQPLKAKIVKAQSLLKSRISLINNESKRIHNGKWINCLRISNESFGISEYSSFNAEENFSYLTRYREEQAITDSLFTKYIKPNRSKRESSLNSLTPLVINAFRFELEGAYDADEFALNILLVNSLKKMNALKRESGVNYVEYVNSLENEKDRSRRSLIQKCLLPFQLKKQIVVNINSFVYNGLIERMRKMREDSQVLNSIKTIALCCSRNDTRIIRQYFDKWKYALIKLRIKEEIELNKMGLMREIKPQRNESFSVKNQRKTILSMETIEEIGYIGEIGVCNAMKNEEQSLMREKRLTYKNIVIDNANSVECLKKSRITSWIDSVSSYKAGNVNYLGQKSTSLLCQSKRILFFKDNQVETQNQLTYSTDHESTNIKPQFKDLILSKVKTIQYNPSKTYSKLSSPIIHSFSLLSTYQFVQKPLSCISPISLSIVNQSKQPFVSLTQQPQKSFSFISCYPLKIVIKHKQRKRARRYHNRSIPLKASFESYQCYFSRESPNIKRTSSKRLRRTKSSQLAKSWNQSIVYNQAKFKFVSQITKKSSKLELCQAFDKWSNAQGISNQLNSKKNQLKSKDKPVRYSSKETEEEKMATHPNENDEEPMCNYKETLYSNEGDAGNDVRISISNLRIKKVNKHKGLKASNVHLSLPHQKKMRTVKRYMTENNSFAVNSGSMAYDEFGERKNKKLNQWSSMQLKEDKSRIKIGDFHLTKFILILNQFVFRKCLRSIFEKLALNTFRAKSLKKIQHKIYELINRSKEPIKIVRPYVFKWRAKAMRSHIRTCIIYKLISSIDKAKESVLQSFKNKVQRTYFKYWKTTSVLLKELSMQPLSLKNRYKTVKPRLETANSLSHPFETKTTTQSDFPNQPQSTMINIKIKHIIKRSTNKSRFPSLKHLNLRCNRLKYYFYQWSKLTFQSDHKNHKDKTLILKRILMIDDNGLKRYFRIWKNRTKGFSSHSM